MYLLSMEMIQIRTEIRGMGFPEKSSLEKSSIAGSRTRTEFNTEVYSSFVRHLYKSGYYSYFIKVGLGLDEDASLYLI